MNLHDLKNGFDEAMRAEVEKHVHTWRHHSGRPGYAVLLIGMWDHIQKLEAEAKKR